MKFKVGDRVRCVSPDENAPVGIVGTVIGVQGKTVHHKDGTQDYFPYIVKYDRGQELMMDIVFPEGCPEDDEGIELLGDGYERSTG